jgi:hypothetical protein
MLEWFAVDACLVEGRAFAALEAGREHGQHVVRQSMALILKRALLSGAARRIVRKCQILSEMPKAAVLRRTRLLGELGTRTRKLQLSARLRFSWIWVAVGTVIADRRRVGPGSFTPSLSQNRA